MVCVVRRGELTEAAWAAIEPLLPVTDGRGRQWRDHRQVLNGILWRLRTGAPWRDVPERYGPWQTCYERWKRWDGDGTWARLLEAVQVKDDAVGNIEWRFSIDSTVARTHQHAAGAQKGDPTGDDRQSDPSDGQSGQGAGQAIGRSRGGLTTKAHVIVEGRGLPMAMLVTAGNVHDSTVFEQLMQAVRVPRPGGGRPRTTPEVLLADKAYSARRIRSYLRARGIKACIPQPADQQAHRKRKGSKGGRPPTFDPVLYQRRNLIERCFNRLKQFRAIATRFDKLASRYRSGLLLASLILWLRELSDTP
ncbi:IS5 family transposase [Actinomadura sp. 1N219]|uniref:IS5 family transposase n=1 Tax=Actinomadura sp. 1N219 TaxID=3375152 RepID=UPI00379C2C38